MSLRDQLLAKGIASKKDAKRVDRAEKHDRRVEKGNQERKNKQLREAEEAARLAQEAETLARLEERRAREAARDRYEQALRVRNLLLGHKVQSRGDETFHHKGLDGTWIHRLRVHPKTADQLCVGALAIAAFDHGTRVEYVLITAKGAEKLTEAGADRVIVHWSRGERGPDEQRSPRDWEPSLRPHRLSGPESRPPRPDGNAPTP